MKLAPLLAALVVALAGCTGSPATSDDAGSSSGGSSSDDSGGPGGPSGPGPDPDVPVGTATLAGRIHDPNNLSIIGARIDVLGTEARTTSGTNGTYVITGLLHGKVTVRVESGGFVAREVEVTLRKGEQTDLDIQLNPDTQFGAGFTMHTHDLWGTATTRVIMDAVVAIDSGTATGRYSSAQVQQGSSAAGAAASPSAEVVERTNRAKPWEFFIPDSPDGLPATVWPGTAEIRFTATWGTEPENKMPRVGFAVQDATKESATNAQKSVGGVGQRLGTVTRGGTVSHFLNATNQTDNGHAVFTAWRFWVWIDNDISKAPNWEPVLALGGIHVKIEIVKGQALVLDPAHRDWWGESDTLVIGDPKADYRPNILGPQESGCMTSQCLFTIRVGTDDIPVIPPGTQKLQVRFSWRLDHPFPTTYAFTYRTANMNPRDTEATDLKVPKLIDSGTGSGTGWGLYEIPVDTSTADPFYVERSNWGFKWVEKNPSNQSPYYVGSYSAHFGFEITAFKHPDF